MQIIHNTTVVDWNSIGRVVTQTRGRAFDLSLKLQKLDRAFERLGPVF